MKLKNKKVKSCNYDNATSQNYTCTLTYVWADSSFQLIEWIILLIILI